MPLKSKIHSHNLIHKRIFIAPVGIKRKQQHKKIKTFQGQVRIRRVCITRTFACH